MHFEVIDGCPVPARLAPVLREIKARSGVSYNSIDRSTAAEPLLERYGKRSQRQLYDGFRRGLAGFNPANPPGRSTHERRNDGVAYPGPAGMPLPYWCVGIDCSDAHAFIRAAAALGYTATLTYPSNPREGHHVNLRKLPRRVVPPLARGSKGPAVATLTRQLAYIRRPGTERHYLSHTRRTFDVAVHVAVEMFQREHGQKGDGIVGAQTARQLAASVRYEKQRRRKARA